MIRQDYLPHHNEIKVFQDDDMFLINSDTEALGEFLEVYKNDSILDIGTNQGALLLYASRFNPRKLTGIDINRRALELAKMNLESNNISSYELICKDVREYDSKESYDRIICNPPYFETKEDNLASNNYKNMAKHETTITLTELIDAIDRNLKYNGVLYFLFLTSRFEAVVCELNKHHLHIKEMKFVYDKKKKYSNVFMVKCVKNAKIGANVLKPLIFGENND